jgi:hypothetical protein
MERRYQHGGRVECNGGPKLGITTSELWQTKYGSCAHTETLETRNLMMGFTKVRLHKRLWNYRKRRRCDCFLSPINRELMSRKNATSAQSDSMREVPGNVELAI